MKRSYHTHNNRYLMAQALTFFCLATVLVALTSAAPLSALAYSNDTQRLQIPDLPAQRVSGHVVPLVGALQPLELTPGNQPLHLAMTLKLRNEGSLDTLLAAQNDPTSSLYHHYLTSQEFNDQFAPTQASVDSVVAYARQQGFQVTGVSSNRMVIDITGTVATADRAFVFLIKNYQLQSRVVYAPNNDPYLPDAIAANVQTIIGLNNVGVYRPINLQRKLKQLLPAPGPGGGYTPDELRTAYDVTPLITSGKDGTGQAIALFEMDGYKPSDIAAYRKQYNLGPLKTTDVLVDGATNTPGSGALEVTLDMEVADATTAGCNTALISCRS